MCPLNFPIVFHACGLQLGLETENDRLIKALSLVNLMSRS